MAWHGFKGSVKASLRGSVRAFLKGSVKDSLKGSSTGVSRLQHEKGSRTELMDLTARGLWFVGLLGLLA